MSPTRNRKTQSIKTDIVIIGAGGSGIPAAVAAAEKGAKVVMFEKRDAPGGNSLVSAEIFACDSPAQKRRNIDAPADHFFKYVMEWHHWKVNPRIVRAFVRKSGDTIRWLEEKGVEFTSVTKPLAPWFIRVGHKTEGKPGNTILTTLMKEFEKYGIRVICGAPVKKILKDSKGTIKGIEASSKDTEYAVQAKAVLICTGGYPANKDLISKVNPYTFSKETVYVGIPEVVGDGLKMAEEVGAAHDGLGYLHYMGLRFEGSLMVSAMNRYPEPIWVNKKGERYCDESIVFDMGTRGNAVERQPGRISFTIFDEAIKNKLVADNVVAVENNVIGAPPGFTWNDLTPELKKETKRGEVKISSNWDEIAKWMDVKPAVLKATVDEYNGYCDQGYDDLFLKDRRYLKALRNPPYYAIKCYSQYPASMGGVKVNHLMEVLDKNDDPIPGLYCAGMEAGGLESETYCYYLTGSILGWVVNSGRIAGEYAADYVKP